jgi:hypothetical protein
LPSVIVPADQRPTKTRQVLCRANPPFYRQRKLDALVGRGSRKDFYDLYALHQRIPLADLLAQGETKYPYARDFALMAVESMVLL